MLAGVRLPVNLVMMCAGACLYLLGMLVYVCLLGQDAYVLVWLMHAACWCTSAYIRVCVAIEGVRRRASGLLDPKLKILMQYNN